MKVKARKIRRAAGVLQCDPCSPGQTETMCTDGTGAWFPVPCSGAPRQMRENVTVPMLSAGITDFLPGGGGSGFTMDTNLVPTKELMTMVYVGTGILAVGMIGSALIRTGKLKLRR